MKINFLITLILLASLNSLAQNTYVPDDKFEQALIDLGYDDVLDDYVLTSRINVITSLRVDNLNIKDLTGIEDFTSIEFLACNDNNITHLDVSNNKELIALNCYYNPLTSLVVSGATKLESLFCYGHELTNLDVSNNLKLKRLSVNGGQLGTIDVTKNSELTFLSCNNSQLTSLDVSNNLFLTSLLCGWNNITELDVSNNPNLIELFCRDNDLTSLNGKNGNNNNFTLFEAYNNPNLTCILVDDPVYSSLNWTDVDDISSFKSSLADCDEVICDQPEVDMFDDVDTCDRYILATIDKGNYYTESNGNGVSLQPEDHIYSSQTIYIYSVDPNNPNCFNESHFTITINEPPNLDEFQDVSVCDGFILAQLSVGNYFTDLDGQGTSLDSGELITRSQTVYIYATNPNNMDCSSETSFDIQIHESIDFELNVTHLEIDHQDLQINIFNPSIEYEFAIDDNSNYQNSPMFFNLSEGDHHLFVRDERGCVEKSLSFTIYKDLYIPKFFTPNNDGENDYWAITDHDNLVKDISVFDRFGRVMVHFLSNSQGWNGYFNGNPVLSTDYWYLIKLNSGDEIKGHFSLKR